MSLKELETNPWDCSKRDVVYHYTTFEGFSGIIDSQTIRMTNAYYLNDKKEVRGAIEIAQNFYRRNNCENKRFLEYLDYLKHNIFSIFLASFTYNGSQLSQWRAYTNNGNGVSLGICKSKLEQIAREYDFEIFDVIYDYEEQEKIIAGLESIFNSFVTQDSIPYGQLNSIFLKIFLRMKPKEFQEEAEIRLVSKYFEYYTDSQIKYRTKANVIIPYIDFRIDAFPKPFFAKVFVGPCEHFDLNYNSVCWRLSATGQCNFIVNSCSSYRKI